MQLTKENIRRRNEFVRGWKHAVANKGSVHAAHMLDVFGENYELQLKDLYDAGKHDRALFLANKAGLDVDLNEQDNEFVTHENYDN